MESHPFRQRYQLSDVWNAMKTERNFDYGFWGHITLDILMEQGYLLFSRCLVIVAVILIFSLILTGYFIVLPTVSTPSSVMFYFHAVFGKRLPFIDLTIVTFIAY
jgi:hypothetical protein